MSKYDFMQRLFILFAILTTVVFVAVGIFSPIEPGMTVFGHVMKTVVGWAWVTAIGETLVYGGGQLLYWWQEAHKEKYGKGWFWKGIKEDLHNLKTDVNWKKVFVFVVIFLAAFFSAVGILELIFP